MARWRSCPTCRSLQATQRRPHDLVRWQLLNRRIRLALGLSDGQIPSTNASRVSKGPGIMGAPFDQGSLLLGVRLRGGRPEVRKRFDENSAGCNPTILSCQKALYLTNSSQNAVFVKQRWGAAGVRRIGRKSVIRGIGAFSIGRTSTSRSMGSLPPTRGARSIRLPTSGRVPVTIEFWWRQNPKAQHPGRTGIVRAGNACPPSQDGRAGSRLDSGALASRRPELDIPSFLEGR